MVRKANIIQKQELGGGKGCAEVNVRLMAHIQSSL